MSQARAAQGEGLDPVEEESCFLFFLPWGRGVARQTPKWLGWGHCYRKAAGPWDRQGAAKRGGDRKRTSMTQKRGGGCPSLTGLLWYRSRGLGFEVPDLASCCCSPLYPAVIWGIGPSLLGFPLFDSGDRGRHSKRGGAHELGPHKLASFSLHQVDSEPGDAGRLKSYSPRAEAACYWGTCSMAWGSQPKPNPAASEKERGVSQWGFP